MELRPSDFIRPISQAENHFLQALLTRFQLERYATGIELHVRLDSSTPAIWHRDAKRYLIQTIPDFAAKSTRYQIELDAFLVEGKGQRHEFDDPAFPFRFASGGTLPILRMDSRDYYCLVYRDVHPVGWNIVNGGTDSRHEMRCPSEAIERELREELMIVDPKLGRCVLAGFEAAPTGHPDFEVAWQRWRPRLERLGCTGLDNSDVLRLKWLTGPDSVTVVDESGRHTTDRCFLNINAEDFGIEIDRIAKINVGADAILCDGELIAHGLLNAVVGLFEVSRFNRLVASGATAFEPDVLFHGGRRRDGARLQRTVEESLDEIADFRTKDDREVYDQAERKFDLCPVPRRLIKRYIAEYTSAETHTPDQSPRVFVSFASEDRRLANRVYEHLAATTGGSVFFSDRTMYESNYAKAIDDALDRASCLVVVVTSVAHLMKEWVQYEWGSFHVELNSGRKPNGQLVVVYAGFNPDHLPRALWIRQRFEHRVEHEQEMLSKLEMLIKKSASIGPAS